MTRRALVHPRTGIGTTSKENEDSKENKKIGNQKERKIQEVQVTLGQEKKGQEQKTLKTKDMTSTSNIFLSTKYIIYKPSHNILHQATENN